MAPVSTPVRKRQLLGNADLSFANKSIVQDDETERQERRKSLAPQRINVNTEEVRNHFELCQKMFIENKITPKNAWNLRIIDYFLEMINTHSFGKEPLQSAASALEICTKVYACRVDDLHAEGMKLANSLAAQKEKVADETLQDDNVETEGTKTKKKKKKPRLALNSERFISKDLDSMLGPVPQLPNVPFNVQMDGDPEQTTNLFTLTVPFDQYYNPHLRDKKNASFLSREHVDKVNQEVMEKFVPKVRNFKICKEFEYFEVNEVDTDFNNLFQSLNASITQNMEAAGQSIFDANGQPIVELEGSIHDIFADQNNEPIQDIEELVEGCHRVYQEVQIVSFCPQQEISRHQRSLQQISGLNSVTTSSVYDMSDWVNKIWIGPNHWKNKGIKRSAQRYSGTYEQVKKPRKQRSSFSDEDQVDFFMKAPEVTAKVKPIKRVIVESKYLLPRNYLKRLPSDQSLMLMNYDLTKGYRAGSDQGNKEEFEHQCQDYNFNNLNDSQYCLAQTNHEGIDPNDDGIQNDAFEEEPLGQPIEEVEIFKQNHLLNFTITVDDIATNSIIQKPYALKAKKINMKRTKAIMLDILRENGVLTQNINNTPDEIKTLLFLNAYKQLKMDLPKTSAEEMSVPIAFFALLHLTNENSLVLKTTEDYKDVVITNEIPPPPHLRN